MEDIEIKLFMTGKLDFEQMKRIMDRRDYGYFALDVLNQTELVIQAYKDICEKKNFKECSAFAQHLVKLVTEARRIVKANLIKLKIRLDLCNLYHQNVMASKGVRVAYVSLGISSLAFILTILQALHFF